MKDSEINLLDIIQVVKKSIFSIVVYGILAGIVAFGITKLLITPNYSASVSMYVYSDTSRNGETITQAELTTSQKLVDTYIVILSSNTVLEKVGETLNIGYSAAQIRSMMTAKAINSTEAFSITITNEDPKMAQTIVNALADIAPEEIIRVVKAGGVEVIDYADLPSSPSSPNVARNVVLGAAFGIMISFGVFLIMDIFDTTIWSEDDLVAEFDIPILGNIPKLLEEEQPQKQKNREAKDK